MGMIEASCRIYNFIHLICVPITTDESISKGYASLKQREFANFKFSENFKKNTIPRTETEMTKPSANNRSQAGMPLLIVDRTRKSRNVHSRRRLRGDNKRKPHINTIVHVPKFAHCVNYVCQVPMC